MWTAPYDLDVSQKGLTINGEFQSVPRSPHGSGAFVLFADGHIEYLHNGKEGDLKALITINGGEDMTKFDEDRGIDSGRK